jgi:two-component system, OmpR family, sensor histidine kinase KdpD
VARGKLRIYVGAAPGVGKTYAMLSEGYRSRNRGTDVVVGYVETHGRPQTEAQIRDLPLIPRRSIPYRNKLLEEMDLDALLARDPAIALVDELAHTNVPGAGNEKRWQDIDALLDAGISVISTVNIQHLESLNDVVGRITGVVQRETVPDEFVRSADQVELVDMSPEALQRRMAHGNIYPPEKLDTALANYFRQGNLAALRELALLWVAGETDEQLRSYRARHGITEPWETRERLVVGLAGIPSEGNLIRRAARIGVRQGSTVVGVHVRTSEGLIQREPVALESHRQLLRELGASYVEVTGTDVSTALLEFARAENATQLLVGASRRPAWRQLLRPPPINRIVRETGPIDVHVISLLGAPPTELPQPPRRYRPASVPPRRQTIGWVLGIGGIGLVSVALSAVQPAFSLPGALLCLLFLVVIVAAVGGVPPAAAATLLAALAADYFFVPPIHSLWINTPANAIALAVFLAVAALVSVLVDQLIRRGLQMTRAMAESQALALLAGKPAPLSAQRLPRLVDELRRTFNLEMVAVLIPERKVWRSIASSGRPVPSRPEHAGLSIPLDDQAVLVLSGTMLSADDARLLQAFVAQLRQAQEEATLAREAARAAGLAHANRLRTALLAAVSHDLRTPLHAIKTAATSILSHEVEWSPAQIQEFASTIDIEADRLTALVENLLDMSRLQVGEMPISRRPTDVADVIDRAINSLPDGPDSILVKIQQPLPPAQADQGLLERALANVLANAQEFSPASALARVEAGQVSGRIEIRVIDQGTGIAPDQRDQLFRPFQRLGDRPAQAHRGLGLGLAIAKGFVEAMDGELTLEDTPGSGATFVFSLPIAETPPAPATKPAFE